jgi:predicted MFS family arabinose efflux permease
VNRPLRRLLALISVAMVVDTAAYATITPLLPGIVDDYGLSKSEAGLLSASYAIGTLALSLPAAALAARIGAKKTLLWALGLLAGSSLVFGLAESATVLTVARLLQGFGAAAIWAAALAWVIAVAPRERRAEAMGTVIGAAIAGALGGPVLGAAADEIGRGVVFGAFVALPLTLIVIMARVPTPPAPPSVPRPRLDLFREPLVQRGVLLMALPAMGFGLINVLVPLRLDDFGASALFIGAIFLVAVVFEAALAPIAGRLADQRGALTPARFGLLTGGVATALLPLADAKLSLAVGVIFAGPLLGMLWTPAIATISDGAESRGIDPAFAFGLANLAWGAGTSIGGSGGGALADATADAVPYVIVGVAAVLAAIMVRAPRRTSAPSPPLASAG